MALIMLITLLFIYFGGVVVAGQNDGFVTTSRYSTNANTTRTHELAHSNRIHVLLPRQTTQNFGTIGDPVVNCYNDGYRVDRSWMIDAIVDACDAFAGVYIAASFPEYDFGFLYPGCTECGEEGAILVTLGYSDTAGTCGTNYPTGVMLDYDTCFSAFHNPIDGCNTSGENGKQGGWGWDPCLTYRVDPNPALNNPTITDAFPDGEPALPCTFGQGTCGVVRREATATPPPVATAASAPPADSTATA